MVTSLPMRRPFYLPRLRDLAAAFCLVLAAALAVPAIAQEATAPAPAAAAPSAPVSAPAVDTPETIVPHSPLVVGLFAEPPFVMDLQDPYPGMAIELWQLLAERLQYQFEYRAYPNVADLLAATAAGDVDVAVSNITVTQRRAETLDFTHPWFDGGMRIMVDYDRTHGFNALWNGLTDAGFVRAYAWIGFVILLATIGYTLFDRRFDPGFPQRWRDGMAESFYTVMSLVTSGKATNRKNLFGWAGRIWQALWLVFGIAAVAYVTSSVTSVMTTLALSSQINSVADLPGKTVGVLRGSTAEEYAIDQNLTIARYDNLDQMSAALTRNDVAAIIGDSAVLEYYQWLHPERRLDVVGPMFHPDKYAFALPRHSPLRRPITAELLGVEESGALETIYERYFGDDPT